ncbi:hypothetical protein ACHAWO_004828 [Cyclotella atomus]|uniref:Uncharacterized protein n=1 Tax=Cyclotella atomus TaxID=382360 RepID=A0ABD3PS35_9STRA
MSTDNIDLTLWEPLPDMPIKCDDFRGFAMASARDMVYISGGNGKVVSKSVYCFNMSTRKWTELPGMNYHRHGHRLAVIEGGRFLFAIGGWGYRSKQAGGDGPPKQKRNLIKTVMRKKVDKVDIDEHIEKLTSYEVYDVAKKMWKEAGDMNESRRGFAMVDDPVSGKIYVFGGVGGGSSEASVDQALSSAEVYNPYENEWDYIKPMPEAKKTCHPLVVGHHIHLFENGKKTLTYDKTYDKWSDEMPDEAFVPKCPMNGKICSTLSFGGGEVIIYSYPVKGSGGEVSDRWLIAHIAHKRTKTWTVLPPNDAFSYYRMAVADGKLVIASGKSLIGFQLVDELEDDVSTVAGSSASGSSPPPSMRSGSVQSGGNRGAVELIKDDGTWKEQPEFPNKPPDFRGYACVSVGDSLYISGGCSGDRTIYRTFLSYNVVSKKWKKLPGMNHRRLGHKMAVSLDGRYIYVVGGGNGKCMKSMGVDIYDSLRECWTSAPGMNDYRVFFGTTVCEGKIFAFGGIGSDNGNQLKTVEAFNPETFSWEFMASMPEARGVCNVITIGDKIYVFGTPSQKVLVYDVASDQWCDDGSIYDLSMPSCPPGGCVCASSSFIGGEVLVIKYPIEGLQGRYRRTANIYDAYKQSWSSVHLLDTFACYSAVVCNNFCVVVTPQNQVQACSIPRSADL